jgi:hypothetical protein
MHGAPVMMVILKLETILRFKRASLETSQFQHTFADIKLCLDTLPYDNLDVHGHTVIHL